jgi:hypothetical protein
MLLTPVKHSKTVEALLTSVADTGEKFLTGVNDASNLCFASITDTGEALK